MAIHKLKTEGDKYYASFDTCIEKANKETATNYSSAWSKDLQDRFGKDYIRTHYDSILFVMIALSIGNNIAACEEQEKEALYREYCYLDAAKNYVESFVEFSATLNKDEKNKNRRGIAVAESYLNSFQFPLQSTLTRESLTYTLFSIGLKKREDLDPQLMDFFSGHPLFRRPFALGKAMDDLKALQKN